MRCTHTLPIKYSTASPFMTQSEALTVSGLLGQGSINVLVHLRELFKSLNGLVSHDSRVIKEL